jgi:hypothetical protein
MIWQNCLESSFKEEMLFRRIKVIVKGKDIPVTDYGGP